VLSACHFRIFCRPVCHLRVYSSRCKCRLRNIALISDDLDASSLLSSWSLLPLVTWPSLDGPIHPLLRRNIVTVDNKVKVKVKQSRKRPGEAQKVPGGFGSQIFMTFGTWRWWGRQPQVPAAFTPRKYSWYSFSLGAESTPGPWYGQKEIRHWKIEWHRQESIPGPSD
jgi:hypothetical protein